MGSKVPIGPRTALAGTVAGFYVKGGTHYVKKEFKVPFGSRTVLGRGHPL